jgi:hypothetical protein
MGCLGVGIAEHSLLVGIPAGVLCGRRDIISKFVLWTLVLKTDMSLEMIKVAILTAMCKLFCKNRFVAPEVAIWTENVVIPALSAGIVFEGERLVYPLVYLVQHLSVVVTMVIQPHLKSNMFLDGNRQESDDYNTAREVQFVELRRYIANCHICKPRYLVPSNI